MHSNNEVGSVFPIPEIAEKCRAAGVLCHTDAAQSCGKLDVSVVSVVHGLTARKRLYVSCERTTFDYHPPIDSLSSVFSTDWQGHRPMSCRHDDCGRA